MFITDVFYVVLNKAANILINSVLKDKGVNILNNSGFIDIMGAS